MAMLRRNLTVVIRDDIRTRYLKYCTDTGIQKGALAERLFDSFLSGKTFTPAEVGALKPVMTKEVELRSPSAKIEGTGNDHGCEQ